MSYQPPFARMNAIHADIVRSEPEPIVDVAPVVDEVAEPPVELVVAHVVVEPPVVEEPVIATDDDMMEGLADMLSALDELDKPEPHDAGTPVAIEPVVIDEPVKSPAKKPKK